jgi:hypothetical protein
VGDEQKGLKDRELQKHYEDLLSLYSSPAWERFADDMAKLLETARTIDGVETIEMLYFRRGQIDIISKILAQPDVTRAAYDMLLADEGSDDE